jgi:hypothetical protein
MGGVLSLPGDFVFMLSKIEKQCFLFSRLLYFFAVYTVTIKYALPITWAVMNKAPFQTYIFFWDACFCWFRVAPK